MNFACPAAAAVMRGGGDFRIPDARRELYCEFGGIIYRYRSRTDIVCSRYDGAGDFLSGRDHNIVLRLNKLMMRSESCIYTRVRGSN